MGKKKRILAWLLSLVMIFGLFGGQVSVVKASGVAFNGYTVSTTQLPSKGGEVTVNVNAYSFEDWGDGKVYYRLEKKTSGGSYQIVEGKDNVAVQLSETNKTFTVDIPENKETTEVEYYLTVSENDNNYMNLMSEKITVAAASGSENPDKPEQPDEPELSKVLPDDTHFRARVVDTDGKPVAGVRFEFKCLYGNTTSVTSDENGVIEYTKSSSDFGNATMALADTDNWACDQKYTIVFSQYYTIESINGVSVSSIKDELRFVVTAVVNKKPLKSVIDKASKVKNADDYSAGYEEVQTALAEAKKVYDNEEATTEEINEQIKKLNAALDALVVKPTDKTRLKEFIDQVSRKENEKNSYTSETWSAVETARTEAKTVYDNAKSGQTEIDEAAENLDTALKGLKYIPIVTAMHADNTTFAAKGGNREVTVKLDGKELSQITDVKASLCDTTNNAVDVKVEAVLGENPVLKFTMPENNGEAPLAYFLRIDSYSTNMSRPYYGELVHFTVLPYTEEDDKSVLDNVMIDGESTVTPDLSAASQTVPVVVTGQNLNLKTLALRAVDENGIIWPVYQLAEDNGTIRFTSGEVKGDANLAVIDVAFPRGLGVEHTYKLQASLDGKEFAEEPYATLTVKAGELSGCTKDDAALKTVTVKYVDENGKEIAKAETFKGYGVTMLEQFVIQAKDVAGYKLVKSPDVKGYVRDLKSAGYTLTYKYENLNPKATVKSVTLAKTSYKYDGKTHKPAVTAKNNKGAKISTKSYTVKYSSGCKNVGQYTATVTFKGDYKGTYTKTFKIVPAGTSLKSVKAGKKSFTATWKKQSKQTSGYQVQYTTDKKFAKSVKTSTVSKNTTVKKAVKSLKAKKTYYVRVRTYKTVKVGKKTVKIYSGWSAAKKIKTK